jgi:hypothetical protein
MLKKLNKLINGEIALGFYISAVFWIAVLGWVTSFAPSSQEKGSLLPIRRKVRPQYGGMQNLLGENHE